MINCLPLVSLMVFTSAAHAADGMQRKDITKLDPGEVNQLNLQPRPSVAIGQIHNRRLFRWHDSQQIRSTHVKLTWKRQVTKTRMKKLEHCSRLTVTGPIDVQGMAKEYVRRRQIGSGSPSRQSISFPSASLQGAVT